MTHQREDKEIKAAEGAPAAEGPEEAKAEAPAATEEEAAPTAEAGKEEPAAPEAPSPAEPEAAPAPQPAPTPTKASGASAVAASLLTTLLVLAALAAAAWATLPMWRGQVAALLAPPADAGLGAVQQRADRLAGEVQTLAQRVAGIEAAVQELKGEIARAGAAAPAVELADLQALAARISAVEGALAERVDPAQVAALGERTQALAAHVQELGDAIEAVRRGTVDAQTVLGLANRVEELETAVRQTQSQRESAIGLLLAAAQLREAVERGAPFADELRTVAALAGGDPQVLAAVEALKPMAQQGVPTRTALAGRFIEQAGAIVRASVGPEEEGWVRRTIQRLASVVTVRRTEGDVAGDSTAAIVARAEAALDDGNLAEAVQELAALQGPPADAAASWLAAARARLTAEHALSDLTAHAIARVNVNARG